MAISLTKGSNVNLNKEAPGLSEIIVGLGWNARATDGTDFDLDASVFILGENEKVLDDKAFIFYNNPKSVCGNVEHQGDNRTGEGDGDDEKINVNLAGLPQAAQKLAFSVTIHEAEQRRQNFGQVSNAYIRILNKTDNTEIARFDLSEDASVETAMIFGELYRNGADWKFKAIGQGFAGGLAPLASNFGVDVG